MLLNPAAQKKAQAELDAILGLGPERLPTTADREKLPYVEACWKESLRWHTIAPEGLAHMVRDDDVYEGYHIPKGTFVMPNIWFVHLTLQFREAMASIYAQAIRT
jgi:cytochrome P450